MRDSPCIPIPLPLIVAAYTNGQRVLRGLDERQAASEVGVRVDQLRAAEAGRKVSEKAFARLLAFNNLEEWADG